MRLNASLVRKMGLPRAPRDVLLELLWLARGRSALVVSQDDVAAKIGMSRKTVSRAMVALREIGLIECERTHRAKDGYRSADRINLLEISWSTTPSRQPVLRDKMSPRSGPAKGTECPLSLRDKMSQPIEDSYLETANDTQISGPPSADAGTTDAQPRTSEVGRPSLMLLAGGRAA